MVLISSAVSARSALLTALERHASTRLIVVGGAGSLEVKPGLQVVDVEGFAERLPDALGLPPEYVKVARAHREALNLYRMSNRNWTYLSHCRVPPSPAVGPPRAAANDPP
jgi:uncharacterized protein